MYSSRIFSAAMSTELKGNISTTYLVEIYNPFNIDRSLMED